MRMIGDTPVCESVEEVLSPARAALVVVDMQNDMLHPDGAYAGWGSDVTALQAVVPVIGRLITAARAADVPVIYTMNTTLPGGASDSPAWLYFKNRARDGIAPSYTLDGTWGQEIVTELAPRPGEAVVKKHRSSPFVATNLELILRATGRETVAVAGVVTNGCIEATVRHAAFLDFYTVLIEDACASDRPDLHDATLQLLGGRHDLARAADVKATWGRSQPALSS